MKNCNVSVKISLNFPFINFNCTPFTGMYISQMCYLNILGQTLKLICMCYSSILYQVCSTTTTALWLFMQFLSYQSWCDVQSICTWFYQLDKKSISPYTSTGWPLHVCMTLHQVVWSRTSHSRVIIILLQGQQSLNLPVHSNNRLTLCRLKEWNFHLRHLITQCLISLLISSVPVYWDRLGDQLTFV